MTDRAARIERVLDVLAPRREHLGNERFAIFEWAHETTPTDAELQELAGAIVDALFPEPGLL